MTALLLTLIGVLTLLVVGGAILAWRLTRRVAQLEARLTTQAAASSDRNWSVAPPANDQKWSLDAPTPAPETAEFVITHLGEMPGDIEIEPVATVPAGQFADIVLREAVIKSASLLHGVRRALSPENRNRIRFEMKREVKRSRKQRRADIREARREWEARQRAALMEDRAA